MNKIVFILTLLILTSLALAQESMPLKYVCVDMPYYMQLDEKGNYSGILVDIFKKTAAQAGFEKTELKLEPALRMIESISTGKSHVWNGIVLPALKDHVYRGEDPIANITLAVFYRGESQAISKIQDLKGKTLIIIRGFSYGGLLNQIKDPANGIHYMETNGHEAALKMMQVKRASYILDYLEPLESMQYKNTIADLNHSTLSILQSYFMVSKKAPFAKRTMERLNKAYKELVARKELPKIEPI